MNDMKAQQTQAENQLAAQNKATMDKAKADAQSRTDSLNGEIKAERANQEKQYEATKPKLSRRLERRLRLKMLLIISKLRNKRPKTIASFKRHRSML